MSCVNGLMPHVDKLQDLELLQTRVWCLYVHDTNSMSEGVINCSSSLAVLNLVRALSLQM